MKKPFSAVNNYFLKAMCVFAAFFATQPVFADLPAAGDVIPDSIEAESPIELGTTIIRLVIQFIALCVGAGATLGVGAQVYKAFSEAKERNGWEDFFKTAAIGVFVIVGVDALAILAYTYVDAWSGLA